MSQLNIQTPLAAQDQQHHEFQVLFDSSFKSQFPSAMSECNHTHVTELEAWAWVMEVRHSTEYAKHWPVINLKQAEQLIRQDFAQQIFKQNKLVSPWLFFAKNTEKSEILLWLESEFNH